MDHRQEQICPVKTTSFHTPYATALYDALDAATYVLRNDHFPNPQGSTIVLNETSREMFIRLVKSCQKKLGREGELFYGHFQEVLDWEIEKVLCELEPAPVCPDCEDGYVWDGMHPATPCLYCGTALSIMQPAIDSEEEFYRVENDHSGSSKLVMVNRYSGEELGRMRSIVAERTGLDEADYACMVGC